MNFNQKMSADLKLIEEVLKKYLPAIEGHQKTVIDAMDYSVNAGGKRLRPILILETYRLFGGENTEFIEPFLAAMEMIHTYSLVHDDLPAMDNDMYRRGKKTTHAVYGEAMGILAGDALLNYAYETAASAGTKIIKCVEDGTFSESEGFKQLKRTSQALMILATKAGIYGMVGGQSVDVEFTEKPLTKEQLDFIYELKTSALIEASMMIGAVLAGALKEEQAVIEKTGRYVGIAFQIQDDILDVTSTTEVLGKPVLSDEKNNKTTYVTLEGLEEAKQFVKELSRKGSELMLSLPYENKFLLALIDKLINRVK